MYEMEIIFLAIGLLAGGVAGWFFARSKSNSSISDLLVEQARSKSLSQQLDDLKAQIEGERRKVIELTNNLAVSEAHTQNIQEKKQELESIHDKLTLQFKQLANDIFEEKSRKFTDQNKNNLLDMLKPLGDKLNDFGKRVEDSHKDALSQNAALKEQLQNLQRLNVQMTREAENLTRALKGDSRTQGAWGEFILESILEKSGLERDREYSIQETFTTNEGRRRPDVIIRLPEHKHVIIDSKVSLTAYNNFVNADSDDERAIALKAHLFSIKQHMKSLGEKNYHGISENGLDFIIMFIPIEPAYILAIQSERSLYEDALDRRIVFVSPSLLIPSLQLIKNVWKQEYQNRHVLEIAQKAGALYDKFVSLTEDLINMGKYLDKAKGSYVDSMNKISVGPGNLVRRVEELKKLGAKAEKNMDQALLTRSEEQGDLFDKD